MSNDNKIEQLHKGGNPKVASLYDRLNDVISDHVQNCPSPVTSAEIVGTLEFLKAAYLGVYDR